MGVLDLLFPKTCLGCGKSGVYLCSGCLLKNKAKSLKCPECTKASIDGFVHESCKRPRSINRIVYFYNYRGPVKKAIKKLKYNFAYDLARGIVEGMALEIDQDILANKKNIILVPVPLHRLRLNKRGFNQAEKLSEVISEKFRWPVQNLVIRNKNTKPQAEIEKKEYRLKNLQSAFGVNPKLKPTINKETLYVIVDDVSTTGTTMREVCKVLKRNGAGEVWGLAVAG